MKLSRLEFFFALFILYTVLGCLVESLGMIVVTAAKDARRVAASLKRSGETVVTLGTIRKRKGREEQVALKGALAVK